MVVSRSEIQVIWLSTDVRFKWFLLSIDSRFKCDCQLVCDSCDFGCQLIQDSNMVVNRFAIPVIWLSLALRFNWLSNDLRFK